jgi:WD40 repeat protein
MSVSRALIGIALLALACGAQTGTSPAAAQPKPQGKKRAAPARAPTPIGAASADRVKRLWEAAAGGRARAVALDRALGSVAFASEEGVRSYELATGRRQATAKPCSEILHRGMAYVDGKLLVACDASIELLEPKQLSKLAPLATHASKITAVSVAFPRVAAGHRDGVVRIYSLDGSATIEIRVPGPPIDVKSLALTRDGSRIAVAWTQGSIWWWDTLKPDVPHDLVRHDSESDALAWSRDGTLLAEEGARNQTTIWSFRAGAAQQTAKLKNGAWVKDFWFSEDGKWLARAGSEGLELAEIAGPRRVALDTRAAVEDIALDERGSLLAAADRDGRLTVWAP